MMKLAVRYVIVCLLALIALQANAQTITVAGSGTAFTASANWQNGYTRNVGQASGTLRVPFDIIITKMSVTLKNVTQYSATSSYGAPAYQWGLGADHTGFTITDPRGVTVTMIPTGWMYPWCAYGAISNFEITDNNGTSLLGYSLYSSPYGGGAYDTYYLCPDAATFGSGTKSGGYAVQSYSSFSSFLNKDAVGTWQLNVQAVDDYAYVSGSWFYYASPHQVTVNNWNLNFQGTYAVAVANPTNLFSTQNVILGQTGYDHVVISNVGGFPLTVTNVTGWLGASTDYKVLTPLPRTLNPGDTAWIVVSFTPSDVNARVASFILNTTGIDASVSPVQSQNFTINLFGTGVAPVMDAQFKNIYLRTQVLCRDTVVKFFKVHNAGNIKMTIAQWDNTAIPPQIKDPSAFPGVFFTNFVDPNGHTTDGANDYSIVYPLALANGGTYDIGSGQTDSIGVRFVPTKEGARICNLVLRSNSIRKVTQQGINASDSIVYMMQGVGLTPHIDATLQNFGQVNQGDTAYAKIRIHNTGSGNLKITSLSMTEGDYKQFKIVRPFPMWSPGVIKPDSVDSCIVMFRPDSIGFLYTRLRLVTNCIDADSAKAFELQGVSRPVARATFAPKELFKKDTAVVGGAPIVRSVTVTNIGGTTLTISGVSFTGNDAVNYGVASALPMQVAAGTSGTLSLKYVPVVGHNAASTGTAVINSNNAGGGADNIALYGFSCQRTSQATRDSLFAGVLIDTSDSRVESDTLSNPGNCPVTLSCVDIVGADASLYSLVPPIPNSIPAGGQAIINVQFKSNRVTTQTPIASLKLCTDSPQDSVITMPLLAKACYYKVLSVPFPHNVDTTVRLFGGDQTPVGGSRAVSVLLQNTGCIPLTVAAAAVNGRDANEYSVKYTPTVTIPPGGIDSVVVQLDRKTAGVKEAYLRVVTSSNEIGTLYYVLDGNPPIIDGVNDPATSITSYELFQNYPNPFNPTTNIAFDVAKHGVVKLEVMNTLGEVVATLQNGTLDAGRYTMLFDASRLGSGTYFYRLSAEGYTRVRLMNLIK